MVGTCHGHPLNGAGLSMPRFRRMSFRGVQFLVARVFVCFPIFLRMLLSSLLLLAGWFFAFRVCLCVDGAFCCVSPEGPWLRFVAARFLVLWQFVVAHVCVAVLFPGLSCCFCGMPVRLRSVTGVRLKACALTRCFACNAATWLASAMGGAANDA